MNKETQKEVLEKVESLYNQMQQGFAETRNSIAEIKDKLNTLENKIDALIQDDK
ncbi:hypothetical protein [Oceanobacillus picturae]|uniref:hypothetical protein n=1 Tax=Oceanobacillus picturae TaxID=171693 RepID=UPI00160326EB|nr:hypothetical protein [Oceanobacillus picturae]